MTDTADGEILESKKVSQLALVLKERRKEKRISQRSLAHRVGVSNTTIMLLEQGKVLRPRPSMLGDIAGALGIDASELIGASFQDALNTANTSGNNRARLLQEHDKLSAEDQKSLVQVARGMARKNLQKAH